MRTFLKTPKEVQTRKIKNINRYFNQANFNGIKENDNPAVADKYSFSEANNVYVDDEDRLVSRLPLATETIENYENKNIVDIFTYGDNKIYVTKNTTDTTKFDITLETTKTLSVGAITVLSNVEKYHITSIENYIICFNKRTENTTQLGTMVFDIDDNKGWLDLKNYAKIPITKSVAGTDVNEYEGNLFTDGYEEHYIYKDGVYPMIPSYVNTADISIKTTSDIQDDYEINDITEFTDYKICKKLNTTLNSTDLFDVKYRENGNLIVIAKEYYMLLSYNNGDTFVKIDYCEDLDNPYYCAIDDTAQYIFFIVSSGIYRYFIGNDEYSPSWTIFSTTFSSLSLINRMLCRFLTGDKFAIWYCTNSHNYLKYLDTNIITVNDFTDNTNNEVLQDLIDKDAFRLFCKYDNGYKIALGDFNHILTENDNISVVDRNINSNIYIYDTSINTANNKFSFTVPSLLLSSRKLPFIIDNYSINFTDDNNYTILLDCKYLFTILDILTNPSLNTFYWYSTQLRIKSEDGSISKTWIGIANSQCHSLYAPYKLEQVLLSNMDVFITTNESFTLPITGARQQTIVTDDYYYIIMSDGQVYTNRLSENDVITIKYIKQPTDNFYKEVPDISLSSDQLMLSFNNETNITYNDRDENSKLLLSMTNLNLQKYIKPVTNLIQISTTEVAIFFENDIKICSKVEDENQASGYRYNYYNTKLSTGVRLGDDVINTLEGTYTLFPTRRGLASLNYQAFMATTDQVIQYISDTIETLWTEFYDESDTIKLLQWRDELIISNGTKTLLLFNIRKGTWYKWTLPINLIKLFTDQVQLKTLTTSNINNFSIFKEQDDYCDYINYVKYPIEWSITSNALDLDAPTYYKNLKQLVFSLCDSIKNKEVSIEQYNNFIAKILLYRKHIKLTDPDVVNFYIDKYGTFVKRFNYWKINVLQWGISSNNEQDNPIQLKMSSISIKYEIGDEVR